MAWKRRTMRSTYTVRFFNRIEGEWVEIDRRVEEYGGYHSFGRFSYKGESLKIFGAQGTYGEAEDYPPPAWRCRTKRALEWHRKDLS